MVDFFQCSSSEGGVGSVGLSLIFSEVEQGAGRPQEKAREKEKTLPTLGTGVAPLQALNLLTPPPVMNRLGCVSQYIEMFRGD